MPVEFERRSVAFFEGQGVPASFFAVPETSDGRRLSQDEEWLSRARGYEANGFDYQLHGYTHQGYEFGAPESWMVQICGEAMIKAEAEGFPDMLPLWTRESLRRKFRAAVDSFAEAFERQPQVFRAGCLAAGDEAFEVMAELEIPFDSNKVVSPRSWDYLARQYDSTRPWDPLVPPRPYRLNDGVVEMPCTGEYAWELEVESAHHHTRLALDDLSQVVECEGVFILMCHQQMVGGESDLPRQVLSAIFQEARATFRTDFITLRRLAEDIATGLVPVQEPPAA